jgi:ER membrane protein complex subunit 8/9
MSRQYSLDRSAFLKILLHSLKFPTTSVSGFLLGEETSATAGQTSSTSSSGRELHIYDAVPVAHNFLTLTLPLETALIQLQEHCKRDKKLKIVGYYQCNERLEDSDLGDVGRKVAGKVESVFPGSVALVVRNNYMELKHLTLKRFLTLSE